MAAHQPLLSMEFSSKNTRVDCLSLIQGIFPTRIEPGSLALQAHSLHSEPLGKPLITLVQCSALLSSSVMSDSLQSYELWPTRPLCPWGFSRQGYWSGLPCPPLGDIPNLGIELGSPTLQVVYLPSEPQGKPKNSLKGNFSTQELNQGLVHCRQILYQLSYREALNQSLDMF